MSNMFVSADQCSGCPKTIDAEQKQKEKKCFYYIGRICFFHFKAIFIFLTFTFLDLKFGLEAKYVVFGKLIRVVSNEYFDGILSLKQDSEYGINCEIFI